jgi:hypothetical protein
MIPQESLLVTLVKPVDRSPLRLPPAKRKRGKPKFYPDHLFLKALVIMIVRHLHHVHEFLCVQLEKPPAVTASFMLNISQLPCNFNRFLCRFFLSLPRIRKPAFFGGALSSRPACA